MLKKRPDPSRGGTSRWSLSYDELCYCQAVVAPRSQKTCQGKYDATACPDVSTCNLWFVDDPTPLTQRQNWNKGVLDRLLQRVYHRGKSYTNIASSFYAFKIKDVPLCAREVNNRLTGWAFAHLVNQFAHPVNSTCPLPKFAHPVNYLAH